MPVFARDLGGESIGSKLQWNKHVNNICKTASFAIKNMGGKIHRIKLMISVEIGL